MTTKNDWGGPYGDYRKKTSAAVKFHSHLNGPGSYWGAGPRKPLQETINDLQNFKDQVIASKQFADDPNLIMDSIIELIGKTTGQIERAIHDHEVRDSIAVPFPNTNDPIVVPRVTTKPTLPVSVEGEQLAPQSQGGTPGIPSGKPVRYLSRRIADNSSASVFDASVPQAGRPLGIFTGKPMPDDPLAPSIRGLPAPAATSIPSDTTNSLGGLAGRLAALAGIDPENPDQPAPQPGGLLGLFLGGQR